MNAAKQLSSNETARFNMIEQQVRTWDVLDPVVLQLLNDVPREQFVPEAYRGLAFADLEIPIGNGQKMLSPKLEGKIVQALGIKKTDKVLHVGAGTGYLTALLAKLAAQVFAVELNADLTTFATQNLNRHQIDNVTLTTGDAAHGSQANAPYDVIVYGASSPLEPKGVRQQLAVGGRLFIVLGQAPVMRATLIQRVSETAFREDILFETCLDALTNAEPAEAFHF
jgi:protein-L-isoaspartate(D-aspartate) O-methyltransferase